jgi:hypothetical protein
MNLGTPDYEAEMQTAATAGLRQQAPSSITFSLGSGEVTVVADLT